jgi:hypothetical protein
VPAARCSSANARTEKMTENRSPEQVFAEQQAKQAISHRYVDPLDADPHYQDQIDRNRIPSASSPLSSSSA